MQKRTITNTVKSHVDIFFTSSVTNKRHSETFKNAVLALAQDKADHEPEMSLSIRSIYSEYLRKMVEEKAKHAVSRYSILQGSRETPAADDIAAVVFEKVVLHYDCAEGATEQTFISRILRNECYDYIHRNFPPKSLKPEDEIQLFVDSIISKNRLDEAFMEQASSELAKKIKKEYIRHGSSSSSESILNSVRVKEMIREYLGDRDIKIPKYKTPKQGFLTPDALNEEAEESWGLHSYSSNLLGLQRGIHNKQVNPVKAVLKYLSVAGELSQDIIQRESVASYLSKPYALNIAKWDLIREQLDKGGERLIDLCKIKGFQRHSAIRDAGNRSRMIRTIEELRICREHYRGGKGNIQSSLFSKGADTSSIPLLSAVLFNEEGSVIESAFKGETGDYNHHCEFNLFDKLNDGQKQMAYNGSLFVTLEPCNKRKYAVVNGIRVPKIPCAVRCARSGIREIWIATIDPHKAVKWEGVKILRTGTYSFHLRDQCIYEANETQTIASMLLQDKFVEWGCPVVRTTDSEIVYQISQPVQVNFFHPDLILEVMLLNREFIGKYLEDAFM